MRPGKKKGLGRGLSALFGDQPTEKNTYEKKQTNTISISDLTRNPYQPRQIFNEVKLEELSQSIKKNGIIQPIAVRPNKSNEGKYEIVAGERRWLAAQRAGLHEVSVVITEADDLKSLEFAIVENVQRHDLNALEEAQGYRRLIDEFGYDREKVSKFIGKSRSHVANTLRLLTLPDTIIKLIENQMLSAGHAKILVGLENALLLLIRLLKKNFQ